MEDIAAHLRPIRPHVRSAHPPTPSSGGGAHEEDTQNNPEVWTAEVRSHPQTIGTSVVGSDSSFSSNKSFDDVNLTPKHGAASRAYFQRETPRSGDAELFNNSIRTGSYQSDFRYQPQVAIMNSPTYSDTSSLRYRSAGTSPTKNPAKSSLFSTDRISAIPTDANGNVLFHTDDILGIKSKFKLMEEDEEVEYAPTGEKEEIPVDKRPYIIRLNYLGILFLLFFVACAILYFVVRATKTLDMGFTW